MASPSKVRFKILFMITLASAVAYVFRTNFSVSGETMKKELGFTEIQLGMIFSAFAWGYAVFQFPGGVFGKVFGARKSITTIALFWGLLALLIAIIPGPAHISVTLILSILIALEFLVGASQAPLFPIVGQIIADWFPVSSWALPNGLTNVGLTLGGALTGPLIVWLMHLSGWRGSFYWTVPLALFIAISWWWYVRNYPGEHKAVNEEERALIESNRDPIEETRKGMWKIALKNREVLLLTLSYFCMNYVFYIFFSWLFYYLVDIRGFQKSQAGVMNSVFWIVGAVGASIGGFLCDRLVRKYGARRGYRLVPVSGMILTAIFLICGAITTNVYLALTLFSLSFSLTQFTDSSYWAAAIAIGDRQAAAAACGILNTGGNAIGGIGGLLVPITAKYFGWPAAIASGALFAILAAVLMLFVRADRTIIVTPASRPQSFGGRDARATLYP
jgi:ACS family glucarate transporter-like MFS transporter